jgi:outer membrane cobalamin receptor
MKIKITILFSFLFFLTTININFADDLVIKKKIRDSNTHREIPHVNVWLKNSSIGTISDISGEFQLKIPNPDPQMVIILQHIAYDKLELTLNDLNKIQIIELQPGIIPLQELEIEASSEQPEIKKDIPQQVSLYKSDRYKMRGFIDAGDLLNTDQSIQVEEQLSGRKNVTLRGGNSDEVLILYNGIKLNNTYDNTFDLSLIDLEHIDRFEIIKGSNTVIYGSDAFSGVINIVPRVQQDYNIRFQQKFGSYNSGTWGLHLYKNLGKFHTSYSIKRGGYKREFSDAIDENDQLENISFHHTANLVYNFSSDKENSNLNALEVMFIRTSQDFENEKYNETLSNANQLGSIRYNGDISKLKDLNMNLSYRWLDEKQFLSYKNNISDRTIEDRSLYFNIDKTLKVNKIDFLFAYQLENAELDFQDLGSNPAYPSSNGGSIYLKRNRHGWALITKLNAPSGSDFLRDIKFDLSFRHELVRDELNRVDQQDKHNWQESMIKFSTDISGYRQNFEFNTFFNYGLNIKFPTLIQLISKPLLEETSNTELIPESNKSLEFGVTITSDTREFSNIDGWQILGSFFKNYYDNKFRSFYSPTSPITFYDNVPKAEISGFEASPRFFFFKKKLTIELGWARYFISEKSAFPFKYDMKRMMNIIVDHAGFGFQLNWFKQGNEIAWVRQLSGEFADVALAGYTDIDIHLSKTFTIFNFLKLFTNLSVRNLLDNDIILEKLTLRDRRFYITLGAQY